MYNPLDPVDRAFKALKSERWDQDKSRLELENRLMQERRTSGTTSRLTKYRALLIAGAFVLVGGAGFAATETGFHAIKKLFVFISIDGEESEVTLELLEGGDATWVTENENGGETTIHLSHSPDGDGELNDAMAGLGGGMVTVDVDVTGTETGDKTVDITVGGEPAEGTIVIEADGGADRLEELMEQAAGSAFITENITTDEQGNTVHILKELAGDGNVKVIELKGDAPKGQQQRMVKIDALLAQEAEGASNVDVEVGEDGIATVHITRPDGTVVDREIDLREQAAGEITVTVDEDGDVTTNQAEIEQQ